MEVTEAVLEGCLGQKVGDVVQRLGLAECRWGWADEPPCVLRGAFYRPADSVRVALYVATDETLFRQFNVRRDWDYDAFLKCRVGGIQYRSGVACFDVGSAIPWQWRP
ncbi:hypothetical protein [Gemmata sp. SH-PL17]|uniref:hypothetical protein n=1 Tax=Gemmata sp. SH-PL17 TaxID=1630693 RepID=UPI0012FA976F|nr:hypothetical protein [Gemmata sp. SH-PL17]